MATNNMSCLQSPYPHQTERRPQGAAVSATVRHVARQHYGPHPGGRERHLCASLARQRAGLPSYRLRTTRNNLQRYSRLAISRWVKVKQSHYRPGQAQRVPGSYGSQIS